MTIYWKLERWAHKKKRKVEATVTLFRILSRVHSCDGDHFTIVYTLYYMLDEEQELNENKRQIQNKCKGGKLTGSVGGG